MVAHSNGDFRRPFLLRSGGRSVHTGCPRLRQALKVSKHEQHFFSLLLLCGKPLRSARKSLLILFIYSFPIDNNRSRNIAISLSFQQPSLLYTPPALVTSQVHRSRRIAYPVSLTCKIVTGRRLSNKQPCLRSSMSPITRYVSRQSASSDVFARPRRVTRMAHLVQRSGDRWSRAWTKNDMFSRCTSCARSRQRRSSMNSIPTS